jgi:hypothetical protein
VVILTFRLNKHLEIQKAMKVTLSAQVPLAALESAKVTQSQQK